MAQNEDCVNFPTKYKSAQDKQVSNVKTRYTKDGKLLGIDISLVDVGNKKKPAVWYITVSNKTYVVNPTDLHDRYEGLYYFCMSSNVSKLSLKEADFGLDYLISILEKINLNNTETKVVNLISKTDSIMIITKKTTFIIPVSILEEDLYNKIKEASTFKEILDYNKDEEETEEEKVKRRKKIRKFLAFNSLELNLVNIVEIYRFI